MESLLKPSSLLFWLRFGATPVSQPGAWDSGHWSLLEAAGCERANRQVYCCFEGVSTGSQKFHSGLAAPLEYLPWVM